MSNNRLLDLSHEIVEDIYEKYEDDGSIDIDEAIGDVVFERISEVISSDNDAIEIIGEIDLDVSPDGDTLFRAIQKASEDVVREHVINLIEQDDRFKQVQS